MADCCHVTRVRPSKIIDSLHVNALPPQIYEAAVWQEGKDWRVILGSAFHLCSPALLHFICSGFKFTHKREVSSMPSPSPLLNPWPDYVAQLPELQWQIEKNTCSSRQQISLICFVFEWFCCYLAMPQPTKWASVLRVLKSAFLLWSLLEAVDQLVHAL